MTFRALVFVPVYLFQSLCPKCVLTVGILVAAILKQIEWLDKHFANKLHLVLLYQRWM